MIWREQMLIFWEIAVIIKQCFQNIRRKFHEFLFQKYFKEMKMLLWSQKVRSLSSKIFNINSLLSWNVFLNFIETDFHWEQEARVLFWKGSYRCLTAGKNLELAQNYYQYITFLYYIIILQIFSIRYLSISVFRTAKNLCYCMFFDIMQLDNMLQIFLIAVIKVHVITNENHRTFQPSSIYLFKVSK